MKNQARKRMSENEQSFRDLWDIKSSKLRIIRISEEEQQEKRAEKCEEIMPEIYHFIKWCLLNIRMKLD
jgi:hypothetical protein